MKNTILTGLLLAGVSFGLPVQASSLTVEKQTPWQEAAIPVLPGRKLEVRFAAKATGACTLENDTALRIRFPRDAASSVNLRFLDEAGQKAGDVSLPVFTRALREYARTLYVPTGAQSLQVILAPAREASLTVENLRATQELKGDEAECINPHPVFRHGDLNPYGFRSGYGGGFYQRPDGVTVWNTGFTGTSPDFPMAGGQNYTVSCVGTGYSGKKSRLVLLLFKKGEDRPFHQVPLNFTGKAQSIHLPQETVRAELLGYDVILESWKIIPAPKG